MSTKTSNKIIFRIGDKVKINNPNFFVRAGYPLSIHQIREEVKEQYASQLPSHKCEGLI